jgi:hypothetical protein
MDNDEKMIQKIIDLLTKVKEDRKADQEDLLVSMDAFHEKRMAMLNAHQKRMTACFGQTEARREYEEPASGNIKDDRNEKTSYSEATEKIEKNPGMMQSVGEHQDVPSDDVVVKPVKGLKKRRRGRKSTAGRRGEPKKLNRENCGSRKKLAAACRKVSRHATVAWRKRNIRRNETQEYCGSWRNTRIAKMARGMEDGLEKKGKDNIAPKTWKGRKNNDTKCKNDIRDRGLKRQQWQLCGKAGIKELRTRRQLRLRIKKLSDRIDRKTFRLDMEVTYASQYLRSPACIQFPGNVDMADGSYHHSWSWWSSLLSYVSVGTTSLVCGQAYNTLCCLLVGLRRRCFPLGE